MIKSGHYFEFARFVEMVLEDGAKARNVNLVSIILGALNNVIHSEAWSEEMRKQTELLEGLDNCYGMTLLSRTDQILRRMVDDLKNPARESTHVVHLWMNSMSDVCSLDWTKFKFSDKKLADAMKKKGKSLERSMRDLDEALIDSDAKGADRVISDGTLRYELQQHLKNRFSKIRKWPKSLDEKIIKLCRGFRIDDGMCIRETIEDLRNAEPVLYWKAKRYRDHLLHSYRVALLGLKILDMKLPPPAAPSVPRFAALHEGINSDQPEPLWKTFSMLLRDEIVCSVTDGDNIRNPESLPLDKLSNSEFDRSYSFRVRKPLAVDDEEYIKRIWLIIALKHDIGYSFTYMTDLLRKDHFLQRDKSHTISDIRDHFSKSLQDVFRTIRTHASSISSSLFQTADREFGHGIIGALHLRGLQQFSDEYGLEIAARAIAKHDDDSRDTYFEDEPFAWLLVLIDELQEWGRPVRVEPKSSMSSLGTPSVSLLVRSELDFIRYGRNGDGPLTFEFDYRDNEDFLREKTGFSFPCFVYSKQLNLSRLVGGPRIDIGLDGGDLLREQFDRLNDADHHHQFTIADWRREVEECEYWSLFELGRFDGDSCQRVRRPAKLSVDQLKVDS